MPQASAPNRCRASETEPASPPQAGRRAASARGPPPRTPAAAPANQSPVYDLSRLHSKDARIDIFRRFSEWIAQGRPRGKSPIAALVKEHVCERTYPKKLYDRVMRAGSVDYNWSAGRLKDFSPACWEAMATIVRDHRKKHRVASSRNLSASLKKGRKGKKAPSANTVLRAKKELNFKKHRVVTKPKLNTRLWKARLEMAKTRMMKSETAYIEDNTRTIFADEKWFSEEKGRFLAFEARDESPVPSPERYVEKQAETSTQQIKIMFLLCVTATRPIGVYKLDFKKWNAENNAKTKAGKVAKGITAAYLKPVLLKVAKDAKKVLGPGPLRFLHDKAPAYQGVAKDEDVRKAFAGGVDVAAGKAPDMSHLDAGVCKTMENDVEREGAQSREEIREVVQKVWKAKITPAYCLRISKRVRKNMQEVVRRKGGNFYKD